MFIKENLIKGVLEIVLSPFNDSRGLLIRTYDERLFREFRIPANWVQENHCRNILKGTIRGLHFILPPYTDSKLIRCIRGKVYDVIVDLRNNSTTKGKWHAIVLSEDEYKWLYIPKGFAHGYVTLEDHSELIYKHDTYYQKEYDSGIVWNDADLLIDWPINEPIISEKDSKLMTYQQFVDTIGGLQEF
jgi:dTDP-4-dehydrorhamnose 3,5-epimerase